MKAKIKIQKDFTVGDIDPRIYGSFVEHLGRCVYGGIYQEDHEDADEHGFRKDVLKLVRELDIPIVRYPGGNFVSGYNWEDGVGPVNERPVKKELAWNVIETNKIGTNEFAEWAKKANVEVMPAVNLGTRGADDARNYVEYCNSPAGTYYSDLRVKHGYKQPHGFKLWCLGNEADGPWQICAKTAYEYGRLACETAKMMKWTDPSIELVACGSSNLNMNTVYSWESEVLEQCYDNIDYISMHQYFSKSDYKGGELDTSSYLAHSLDMDKYIDRIIATCDYVGGKRKTDKKINISFDEWNVWFHNRKNTVSNIELHHELYTMEDALLFGSMMLSLLRRADRVKIGCQAQLVNVIAPIMTAPTGKAWKQTIFYPYLHASKFARGKTLISLIESPKYDCETQSEVPYVDALATETNEGITVLAINKSKENIDFSIQLGGYETLNHKNHTSLYSDDILSVNNQNNELVTPKTMPKAKKEDNTWHINLPPYSWNCILFN